LNRIKNKIERIKRKIDQYHEVWAVMRQGYRERERERLATRESVRILNFR
jgi:hypothetical protein